MELDWAKVELGVWMSTRRAAYSNVPGSEEEDGDSDDERSDAEEEFVDEHDPAPNELEPCSPGVLAPLWPRLHA